MKKAIVFVLLFAALGFSQAVYRSWVVFDEDSNGTVLYIPKGAHLHAIATHDTITALYMQVKADTAWFFVADFDSLYTVRLDTHRVAILPEKITGFDSLRLVMTFDPADSLSVQAIFKQSK